MIFLASSLFVLLIATGTCLFYSIKRNIELMDKLEEIDEMLINVFSTLEEQHRKIEAKTQIEVFSDEPIVRELVQDIRAARDAVKNAVKVLKEIEFAIDAQDLEENNDEEEPN